MSDFSKEVEKSVLILKDFLKDLQSFKVGNALEVLGSSDDLMKVDDARVAIGLMVKRAELKKEVKSSNELQDPYSSSIDEFLMEKNGKSAQENAEDELEDQTGVITKDPEDKGLAQDPQENLEDAVDEEADTILDDLKAQQQDLANKIEDMQKKSESYIESSLKLLACQIESRGYKNIASSFHKLSK